MQDLIAKRTLVKSPPELWNELSELERLAKHLDAFGEIKITKLEPEHTVAWEGEGASGTVSIEPAGWGTKVTLTAQVVEAPVEEAPVEDVPLEEAPVEEAAAPEPEIEGPEPDISPPDEPPSPRRGFLARLFGGRRTPPSATVDEATEVEEEPVPEQLPVEDAPPADARPDEPQAARHDPCAILDDVLDSLGAAHHRPFSRG